MSEQRFKVIEKSNTGHCCFYASIVDTSLADNMESTICEFFPDASEEDWSLIVCELLNEKFKK